MSEADQYDFWRRRLAGEVVPIHDGEPQSGFYRLTRKNDAPRPIAYWFKDGELRCRVGVDQNIDEQRAREWWPWASKSPVAHEVYKAVLAGEPWPDMDPIVGEQLAARGHNNPPTDDAELLKEQIEAARGGMAAYAKIEDDETLRRAQSLRSRLLELAGEANKNHKAEKEPHLAAGRAVDKKWFPLRDLADAAAKAIRGAMDAWETEKLRRQREAERVAAEQARAAQEAADKAAAEGKPAPQPVAPPPPPPPAAMPGPIKGAYGRAAAVKTVFVVTAVTDWSALFAYVREQPELQALMRKLAQRAVDNGERTIPGCTIEEQRKTA